MHDVKVIGGKDCVSQHKLLVGDIELNTSFSKSRCILPKRKLWKLSNPEVRLEYGNCVHESAQSFQNPQNFTVPGPKSKPAYLMHVTLFVVGHGVVSQNVKKHGGGMMKLTPSSKKKEDFGKSSRMVEIKKSIFKQKGSQSQLYTLQGQSTRRQIW